MAEFLPPIVLPIEAKNGDLIKTLAESDAEIQAFARKEKRTLDEAGEEGGHRFARGIRRGAEREMATGALFAGLGRGLLASLMPATIGSGIFGIGQAIAAIAPAVGALGLIPAALAGAVVGISTLKMAFKGLGGAISAGAAGDAEKYAEALKHLAPAARDAARGLVALHPLMVSMQQSVQQSFFAGWSKDLQKVGQIYLPLMRTELSKVAAGFGDVAHWFTDWLKIPDATKSIAGWMANLRQGLVGAAHVLPGFISGMNDIIAVGSKFLPSLGAGLAGLGDRFSEFAAKIAGNGQLEQWIQGGLDALKLLGPLLKDVWGILHPIIAALQQTTAGGLGVLGTLLHQLSDFLNSTQGADFLTSLFGILSDLSGILADALMNLLPVLGQTLTTLKPLFDTLAGLSPDVIRQLAESLTEMLVAWAPAIPPLAELTAEILPLLVPLIKMLGEVIEFTAPSTKVWADHFLSLLRAAKDLFGTLRGSGHVLRDVGHWFSELPGIIGSFLSKLPGEITEFAKAMMNDFAYAVGFGIGFIMTEWWKLPGQIWDLLRFLGGKGRELIANVIVSWVKFFIDFGPAIMKELKKLPGQIVGIWIGANVWLFQAGVDLIEGLIKGVASRWMKSMDLMRDLGRSMIRGFADAIGWHSPAAMFIPGGASIVAGVAKGVSDNAHLAVSAVSGMLGPFGRGPRMPVLGLAGVGGMGGFGGRSQPPPVHIINRLYVDGKELHLRLIQPAQRYKERTGKTGLS